jgi:hypothetical protein
LTEQIGSAHPETRSSGTEDIQPDKTLTAQREIITRIAKVNRSSIVSIHEAKKAINLPITTRTLSNRKLHQRSDPRNKVLHILLTFKGNVQKNPPISWNEFTP